jgi:hypothetical protein
MTDTLMILLVVFVALVFACGAAWQGFEREQ